jgi:two-component system NtrC family sensor kinase
MNNGVDYKVMYHAFREISTLMHSSRTLREVIERTVWKSTEILNAKGALLRLRNAETGQFEVAAAYGLGEWYLKKGPVSTERILADLPENDQVVIIEDIMSTPRVEYPREAWQEGIRMMLDVPLTLDQDIIGLLRVYLSEKRTFFDEEKNFIIYTAEQCACAINKVRFIENQRAKYDHLALQTEKLSALGRMAAGIAHEINNPLAGILLFGSNLSKKVPSEGPLKEGLDVIVRETVRCKSIIQELLEFSRDREPQMAMAGINEIIEKALSILENEFRLRHIRLEKDLAADLDRMCLDANQMEQVFVNILINALQATPEKGVIDVRSRRLPDANMVRIEITDTGCGIAPEHLSRIFDPFYSTKEKGTGLGLAVSYGIVRNHKGMIRVASEPHKGSRFTIDLPVRGRNDAGKGDR